MTAAYDSAAAATIDKVLGHIASPGSFFSGAERVSIASHARAARGIAELAAPAPLPEIAVSATARIAADAMSSRQSDVEAWKNASLDVLAYVELVSVTAQIAGIDSYHLALGEDLAPLPTPIAGMATPNIDPEARVVNAWVPTVGIAVAPTALSALPLEKASKKSLGEAWYLADQMIHKYGEEPGLELSRPQMEFVAARTSWLNECFF